MTDGAKGVHAVVWGSGELPRDLVSALDRQGITWEEAEGRFGALARVLARRGASGGSRVLLLVEPAGLAGAEEVRAAVERFDPGTSCWCYSVSRSPRLSPMPPAERAPEVVVQAGPRPGRRPGAGLRLSGEEPAGRGVPGRDERPVEGAEEAPAPRSLLTAEELAMLLADDRE